jgi:MFS family permease
MTTATKAKWLRFLALVLGGGTIYKLANLKDAFYIPMQEAMGLTYTEIGALLSIDAIVATALFIVGGFLADRFVPRRLIPVGLIGAGALGLYMATFPGFGQMMAVFALLAICADCFSAARRAGIGSIMRLSVVDPSHDRSGRARRAANFLQWRQILRLTGSGRWCRRGVVLTARPTASSLWSIGWTV